MHKGHSQPETCSKRGPGIPWNRLRFAGHRGHVHPEARPGIQKNSEHCSPLSQKWPQRRGYQCECASMLVTNPTPVNNHWVCKKHKSSLPNDEDLHSQETAGSSKTTEHTCPQVLVLTVLHQLDLRVYPAVLHVVSLSPLSATCMSLAVFPCETQCHSRSQRCFLACRRLHCCFSPLLPCQSRCVLCVR